MSATIMMPQEFEQAIRSMCGDAVTQAISTLADKYGFDVDEASRLVNLDELKLVRKRGPSPKKDASEKSVAKTKKATKSKADDPEKPKTKRGPTGYLLFASHVRPSIRAKMEAALGDGEKLKPQEVVKEIAVHWKALTEEERGEWNTKAKTPQTSDGEEGDDEE